ncbi:unnamed protein product [Rotaria sp. Silwood1]|nr:unnamed protein product [Rotaria sp. Silwood1]
MAPNKLSAVDYVILVILLLSSAVIGAIFGFFKSNKNSAQEFLLAAGLNIWVSVISIGVICTFYSSVGGMKAVIWTDVLQSIVMFVGLLAVIIQGLISLGGFKRTFSIASRGGRIEFDSADPRTRHTIWSLIIGGSINALATYGFNQAQVQRYMCIRSTRSAKQALFMNAVGSALIVFLSTLIGVIIYAYYADCDPYTTKKLQEIDQILPYFVMEVLGDKKGLPGVFLACIFSGSLSTISSGLNSLAAVLVEDVYKGLLGVQITKRQMTSVILPLSIANCTDITNSTLTNWTTSTTIPTFLKRDPLIDLYSVSYMWYTPIAVITVVLVGIIVSYLTGPLQPHDIDPKLIISVSAICCSIFPKRWHGSHQCDVNHEAFQKRQNDNNDMEMMTHGTHSSDHRSPSVQMVDTKPKVLIKSNMVAPALVVSPLSAPVTTGEVHDSPFAN